MDWPATSPEFNHHQLMVYPRTCDGFIRQFRLAEQEIISITVVSLGFNIDYFIQETVMFASSSLPTNYNL